MLPRTVIFAQRRVFLLEYSNECDVVVTRAERRLWSSEL